MVFILQQILPKYRYDVLKYLNAFSFKILYSDVTKEKSLHTYKAKEHQFIEIPVFRIGEKYIQNIFPEIKKHRPKTIVYTPELRNFTFWILLFLKPFFRFSLVAWSHGINNNDFFKGKLSIHSKFRLFMMKLSDKVIVYSKDRALLLEKLLNREVEVANNTLDTIVLDEVYKKLKKEDVSKIRQEIGSPNGISIIYVGRLIQDKDIEKSLDLFKELRNRYNNIFYNIIGDGPHRHYLEEYVKSNKIQGIVFRGAVNDPDLLGKWLYISDFHFHLGYVGLAVVHSLCFETPIVTIKPDKKTGPFHSPEFVYLNESNSIIQTIDKLQVQVERLITNKEELNQLKKNARDTYKSECGIRKFLEPFEALI